MSSDINELFAEADTVAKEYFKPLSMIKSGDLFLIFSDEEVCKYLQVGPMKEKMEAEELSKRWEEEYDCGKSIHWGVKAGEDDDIAGVLGIQYIDWENRKCELSAVLRRDECGKRRVSGIMPLMLEIAFEILEMERVEIRLTPGNIPSEKIAGRFGFKHEGVLRDYIKLGRGMFLNESIFSMLKEEYSKKQHVKVEK